MKETALTAEHQALGARLVPFAGWSMPLQYTGILDEARTVRRAAGLFDLGHMGRVRILGENAEELLQRVQTNDVAKIPPGGIRYSMFLTDRGTVIDDILVYREAGGERFFLVVNASNADRDLELLRAAAGRLGAAEVVDQTDELGMFAIQGPRSEEVARSICDADLAALRYYRWTPARVAGVPVEISRTGYTGEDGFEVYVPREETVKLWRAFLAAGRDAGLSPVGLGARDTLRLEAGMPLYGHEITEDTNPLEAGLSFAVKFTHDFTGRAALEEYRARVGEQGGRRLVGLTTPSRRVPRQGYRVLCGDEQVGEVCSGAASPTLETNIATCYVPAAHAEPGTRLSLDMRGKLEPATVTPLPFYKREEKK